jgi:hypothetical protein
VQYGGGDKLWHKVRAKDSPQFQAQAYAFKLRWLDFVLTLNAENGRRQLDRQSDVRKNWVRERSFGLCQLMDIYHAPFIWKTWRKETSRPWLYKVDIAKAHAWGHTDEFMNYQKHVEYCARVWDNAVEKKRVKTTFYGYNVRHASNNGFYLYK